MRVFDAYPLAAILLGEHSAAVAAQLLAESLPQRHASVSAVNLAEVIDLVARRRAVGAAPVVDAVELWIDAGLVVEAMDWSRSTQAATLRVAHYHRQTCPVSLSDCAAVALARELRAELVTSDAPMIRVARAEGVEVRAVPDSSGTFPR